MPQINCKSGVHRIAGIALFRALLQQCRLLPSTVSLGDREALSNIVRNRFKRNRHVNSERFLTQAFDAGYGALQLLRSASSSTCSPLSLTRIQYILKRVEPSYKATPPPTKRALQLYRPRGPSPRGPLPFEHSVFARPALSVKGVRKVPHFVNAMGFPMLRVKKPQPVTLTRAIVAMLKRRAREVLERDKMIELLPIAKSEDNWDELLLKQFGRRLSESSASGAFDLNLTGEVEGEGKSKGSSDKSVGGKNPEQLKEVVPFSSSWMDVLKSSLSDVHERRVKELNDNLEKAKQLQAIVEKEKVLAVKERRERLDAAAATSSTSTASPDILVTGTFMNSRR